MKGGKARYILLRNIINLWCPVNFKISHFIPNDRFKKRLLPSVGITDFRRILGGIGCGGFATTPYTNYRAQIAIPNGMRDLLFNQVNNDYAPNCYYKIPHSKLL